MNAHHIKPFLWTRRTAWVLLVVPMVYIASAGSAHAFLFNWFGPERVILRDDIQVGNIELDVEGTGRRHGYAVKGFLVNKTDDAREINVTLVEPLYLVNPDASAQDMVITKVYRADSDGRYSRVDDDGQRYILLDSNEKAPIQFVSYCGDYARDAPDSRDKFINGKLPAKYAEVAEKIKRFRAKYKHLSNDEVFDAAQIAFWRADGVSVNRMSRYLSISSGDIRLASAIGAVKLPASDEPTVLSWFFKPNFPWLKWPGLIVIIILLGLLQFIQKERRHSRSVSTKS